MKAIKLLALMMVVSLSVLGNDGNIKIKGKVLNSDNCIIVVMYELEDGTWERYDVGGNITEFKLKLEDNFNYKIIFEGDERTKVLEVKKNPKEKLKIIIDVDFNTDKNCRIAKTSKGFYKIIKTKNVIC